MGRKRIIPTAREQKIIEKIPPYKWKATLGALRARRKKERDIKHRWYEANKERTRERDIEYRKSHKDYYKKWCAKNKEKIKIVTGKWRAKNRERIKEKAKASGAQWRKNNPGKANARWNNYRSKKLGNGGMLSRDIYKKLRILQKNKCAICRKRILKTVNHLDHIIPLARGGKNIDSNIQLTCSTCNLQKGAKDPIVFMQEKGFLL